jgi:hypothetical protein
MVAIAPYLCKVSFCGRSGIGIPLAAITYQCISNIYSHINASVQCKLVVWVILEAQSLPHSNFESVKNVHQLLIGLLSRDRVGGLGGVGHCEMVRWLMILKAAGM